MEMMALASILEIQLRVSRDVRVVGRARREGEQNSMCSPP